MSQRPNGSNGQPADLPASADAYAGGKYGQKSALVMHALYEAEKEFGWLSPEALEAVSKTLNVSKARLKGVSSFYSMYRHRPLGRHIIRICTNISCMLFGGEHLVEFLREKLSLDKRGTSDDGRYTLQIAECIGACDGAPAMLVDEDLHTGLGEDNILEILQRYE